MVQLRLYGVGGRAELEAERRVPCPVCGGDFKRCRLDICPFLKDVRDILKRVERSKTVFGSSPPSALVGSWGYPKVLAGPLVPPLQADTSLMERYDLWVDLPLENLLKMRLSLVRGKRPVSVRAARNPDRLLQTFQELALAYAPTDVEMRLSKEPRLAPGFRVRAAPTGPSAAVEKAVIAENPAVPRPVEKAVSDLDLKASEAVVMLRGSGVDEAHIVRLLSLGLLGTKRWRKLVPTEWSITAVDDIIGKRLRARVKQHEWLDKYFLHSYGAHHNRVTVLLLPGPWMFEVIEIWHKRGFLTVYQDSELPGDVERYPENVGGAYHALRLPVLEKLDELKRQAAALVIAEVEEGWIPLGVWRFREICRRALASKPQTFSELREALCAAEKFTWSSRRIWEQRSRLLRFHEKQTLITKFVLEEKI